MSKRHLKLFVLSLYTLLIVCMGIASLLEKTMGKSFALESVYSSWWFALLWTLLSISSMAFLIQQKVHRRMSVFMLHVSFVVMLVGAFVTHLMSDSGTVHLRKDVGVTGYVDDAGADRRLPFCMKLHSFELLTYPGTDVPMDYRSCIEIKHDGKVETMCVSMNNIGTVDGYRFYQSAYDSDCCGTLLLVAHDPYGIAITYVGYLMLFVSLLWTLCSRHTRIRTLYRTAMRPLSLLFAMSFFGTSDALAIDVTPVNKQIANDFGTLVVFYNGRLCPVNTAAQEFVTKLSGRSSWKGHSANEIFMGWMIYYTEWESQKLICVKNAEVQRLLGIDGRWACVRDFYNADHTYKLAGKENDTSLSDATRKAIREADEKIQVVSMFYDNEMLKLFPLPAFQITHSSTITWHTPGSTELPLDTPEAEFQFINHAMDHLVKCILVDDVEGAQLMISKIRLFQREKAGSVLPPVWMMQLEIAYNALQSARWIVFLLLALNLMLALQVLRVIPFRFYSCLAVVVIIGGLSFLSLLLIMRWLISGHVPMSNGYETMLFMAWATLIVTLFLMRSVPVMKAFGPLVSCFCMLVSELAVGNPQITPLVPVLQSPLLSIHVALVMIAYTLLALVTLTAFHGLWLVHTKAQPMEVERNLALSQLLLYPAVAFLAMGIFVGAVWANVSWGIYWSWDPKETWALITLMIYAIPLHKSFMPSTATRYYLYVICSFLAVAMTYFGVNYFLGGMHSYA